MKDFSFFLENGSVKNQLPDKYISDSLIKDAIKRFEYAKNSIKRIEEPKFAYENLYECLRELIDSILFLKGFKSFSHEATIS